MCPRLWVITPGWPDPVWIGRGSQSARGGAAPLIALGAVKSKPWLIWNGLSMPDQCVRLKQMLTSSIIHNIRVEQHSAVLSVSCLWHIFGVMGGAMEAPHHQAGPHSHSFYYHSLVTGRNNTGHFISFHVSRVDIHLSIRQLRLLTALVYMGRSVVHTSTYVYVIWNVLMLITYSPTEMCINTRKKQVSAFVSALCCHV